ncbi:PI-PLC X domain-containing protein 1-like Protein [Tribolium castaneum]|uniref:PI-PLC X domain-containing protein 1-like Protein n=2 Tax=Tribolium castaneum TaxID=7070 RepID=A0A139WNA6_TRICA|nr:PREDICTED: PI-PLC X domain-containing protein 1-like [Tribolium castaneum]KYB29346.1 PI-PLC X domain-containing protein 1-like Protein [Tribolium castaneum]|eukprot:XP_015840710.1 PREDICTED: PI-PLC X domain-containing protein 1-like [Tribolium castaneum]
MIFLFPLIFQLLINLTTSQKITTNNNPCGQLYLTQSPKKNKNLQINWHFTCNEPPDTILLTFGDLRANPSAEILYQTNPGSVIKGFQETQIPFKNVELPGNWSLDNDYPDLKAECFDYYITSRRNNSIIHSQCLSIQPAWMSNFGDLRIGDMMIPGTHNSGAWRTKLPGFKNYVLNQDKSMWEQLVYGIRYFDIRVGRYGDSPQSLYINHDFVKCTELVPELQSVAKFLQKSPKEVVVLDFHRFPHPKDFLEGHHLELLRVVRDIFGDLIYPYSRFMHPKGPKLREFWQSQKRVIISYRQDYFIRRNPWLWPGVQRDWGNVQKLQNLENFVKTKISKPVRGNPLNVLMAELTPNYRNFLQYINTNLKDLALMVNRELTEWVIENNFADNLNIIATDFFTGNDMISVAIGTNFRKLQRSFFH